MKLKLLEASFVLVLFKGDTFDCGSNRAHVAGSNRQ